MMFELHKPGFSSNAKTKLSNSNLAVSKPTNTDNSYDGFISKLPIRNMKSLLSLIPKLFAEIEFKRATNLDVAVNEHPARDKLKNHKYLSDFRCPPPEIKIANPVNLSKEEFCQIILGNSDIKVNCLKQVGAPNIDSVIEPYILEAAKHFKGIPLAQLALAFKEYNKDDTANPLNESEVDVITDGAKHFKGIPLAQLAIAYDEYQKTPDNQELRETYKPLILVSMASIGDIPIREDAKTTNLLMVNMDENKSTLKHATNNDLYNCLGEITHETKTILVCNNWKSAKGIHDILQANGDNRPVVAALNYKETKKIVHELLLSYPKASIVLAADNLHGNLLNQDKNKAQNFGLKAAIDIVSSAPDSAPSTNRVFIITPTFNYKNESHQVCKNYIDYDAVSDGKAYKHIVKQHEHIFDRIDSGVSEGEHWAKFYREQQVAYNRIHKTKLRLFDSPNIDCKGLNPNIETCHAKSIQEMYTSYINYIEKRNTQTPAEQYAEAAANALPITAKAPSATAIAATKQPEPAAVATPEPEQATATKHKKVVLDSVEVNTSNTDVRFDCFGKLPDAATTIIVCNYQKHAAQLAAYVKNDGVSVISCKEAKHTKAVINDLLARHPDTNLRLAVNNNHASLLETGKTISGWPKNVNMGLKIGIDTVAKVEPAFQERVRLIAPDFDYTKHGHRFGRGIPDAMRLNHGDTAPLTQQLDLADKRQFNGASEVAYWTTYYREQQAFYNKEKGTSLTLYTNKHIDCNALPENINTTHSTQVKEAYVARQANNHNELNNESPVDDYVPMESNGFDLPVIPTKVLTEAWTELNSEPPNSMVAMHDQAAMRDLVESRATIFDEGAPHATLNDETINHAQVQNEIANQISSSAIAFMNNSQEDAFEAASNVTHLPMTREENDAVHQTFVDVCHAASANSKDDLAHINDLFLSAENSNDNNNFDDDFHHEVFQYNAPTGY